MRLAFRIAGAALGVVLGLILLGALALILLIDTDAFRNFAARQASVLAGRAVAIEELEVKLGRRASIRIDGVSIDNAEWGQAPELATFDRLAITADLIELLQGQTLLHRLVVTAPKISLERREDGTANWDLPPNIFRDIMIELMLADDRTELPIVEHLEITEASFAYLEPARGIDVGGMLETLAGEGGNEKRIELNGQGHVEGAPFRLAFAGGPFGVLRDPSKPYPIDLTVGTTDLELSLAGSVTHPLRLAGRDFTLEIESDDLATPFALAGLSLPPMPPFRLSGELADEGELWRLDAFEATLGGSDLAGDVGLRLGGDPPAFEIDARSNKIDVVELSGLLPRVPDDRLIPDQPIRLDGLRAANGTARWRAQRIVVPGLPIDDVEAELTLEDGTLRLQPVGFRLAGGEVTLFASIYGTEEPAQIDLLAQLRDLGLKEFIRDTPFAANTAGRIDGIIELSSRGASPHALAAAAQGDLRLAMAEGTISGLIVERIGLDVAEALALAIGEDAAVPVRCLVIDLDLEGGVASTQTMMLDTADSQITAAGRLDLGAETIDLTLTPQPKDVSFFSLRSELKFDGPLADLSVTRDVPSMLRFLPPVDLGTAEDAPCKELIEQARKDPR